MRVDTQVTPEEFRRMDLPEDRDWELHEGEIVELRFPSWSHRETEDRLVELLAELLSPAQYLVLFEMPFEPGVNVRSADVGIVRNDRDPIAESYGVLPGAPEMVVEVWSPSSRRTELAAYRKLCFEHGTLVFWLVHPQNRTVAVTRRDDPGKTVTFEMGEHVPLAPLSVSAVPVADIFVIGAVYVTRPRNLVHPHRSPFRTTAAIAHRGSTPQAHGRRKRLDNTQSECRHRRVVLL